MGRDPGLQPLLERGGVPRVVQLPARKPVRNRLIGGAGLARGGPAADRHQPAGGHGRVQDGPQQLTVRPADIRWHRPAADHRVHAQLHRIPPPCRTAIRRLVRGQRGPRQVRARHGGQDPHDPHYSRGHAEVKHNRQQHHQHCRHRQQRQRRHPGAAPASGPAGLRGRQRLQRSITAGIHHLARTRARTPASGRARYRLRAGSRPAWCRCSASALTRAYLASDRTEV